MSMTWKHVLHACSLSTLWPPLPLLSAGANIGGFASGPAQAPPGLPSGTCPPDLLSRWITGASFLPWCALILKPLIFKSSTPDTTSARIHAFAWLEVQPT